LNVVTVAETMPIYLLRIVTAYLAEPTIQLLQCFDVSAGALYVDAFVEIPLPHTVLSSVLANDKGTNRLVMN